MSDSGSWDAISGADSNRIVLSVDFPVARHREASFAELAKKIGSEYRFLQTKLPAAQPGLRVSGDACVDHWIDDIRGQRPVLAVLGYRVGSVYAAAIAEGISRWQPAPRVILFDPQFASIKLLGRELSREINAISSLLSDDEIERARKLATEIAESGPGDVQSAATAATEIYWEISSAVFERVGLCDVYCSKSFASFESYMSLISAACQIDPSRTWRRSTTIMSSDFADLTSLPSWAGNASSLIGRSIPFDVSHDDLLRSESVAKTVLDLLELR